MSLKILIGCEMSGVLRDAFSARGHDTWSCDLIPSLRPGNHLQADLLDVLDDPWDMAVLFPPCTRLCVSGARWFKKYQIEQDQAVAFVKEIWRKSPWLCGLENPIGVLSTRWQKPTQIIQPWQFGHGETKATCLWLRGLPALKPTNIVAGREARIHKMPPSKDRGVLRSMTYQGIADAMADQWTAALRHREVA